MKTSKVFLWSSPRNVSTALMYSFAQRKDCKVYDEPLYGYYLQHTDADSFHPGAEMIKSVMETDGEKVIELMLENSEYAVQFFKNMTHHLVGLSLDFLSHGKNVILTREPREMIMSYTKVIPNPQMKDVGYKQQYELLRKLESRGIPAVVLDSKELLLDPKGKLEELCDFLEIPFDDAMLKWEKGGIAEDGVWAEYWYENVHNSSSFQEYQSREGTVKPHLQDLLEDCNAYYEKIMKWKL